MHRARLVRARPGSRGVRGGVRRGQRRHATPSASATAPTRSRCCCARRHRPRRRSDRAGAVGRLHRAGRDRRSARRPVFADVDPEHADARSRGLRRGDHAAHAGHRAGAPVRAGGRHGRHRRRRRAPRARARRRLLPGAPRDLRRACRSARAASAAPSASIRPRISARSATAARSSPTTRAVAERVRRLRNGGQTRPLPSRRSGRQQPARRAAGGDPPRAAAAAAGMDRAAPRARRALPRAAARRGRADRASATPVTCIICSRCERRDATALQAHLRAAGIETLVHYPVAAAEQPAFARVRSRRDCPVADACRRANCCRCRSIRVCTTPTSARVADAVGAFVKGRVPA